MPEQTNIGELPATEADSTQAEKFYTQKEVDDMMARTRGAIQKKYERTLSELGDIEELKQLKQQHETQQQELMKKRGEFDKIISELAAKKDAEIRRRDEIIKNYTVDLPLVETAAKLGAVNPQQVKQLLKNSVRVGEEGQVEVLDDKGQARYSDNGKPLGVEDLVKEFLDQNLHFKSAGPTTSATKNSINQTVKPTDISKLNLRDPEQRKLYRELRNKH